METYETALSYAIPMFITLIIIEALVSWWQGKKVNRALDTISSLSSGVTNTLFNLMGLTVVILSYEWMVANFALLDIKAGLLLYILAFLGLDFAGYWSHRFNHEINVFWNRHIIHHSSEEYNLSCALRQSISAFVSVYFFLYIPMAIIGIPAEVVATIAPIHFFAQFWYHTRLIGRMGFLEHIIVTPSHHRVHHAINPIYIDKNYSEIFIVWDKWFGTFQEELPDEPPVYGTKKQVNTWNPILINFMHLWGLAKDAWRTQYWWDKVRIWFMPTGWRPADLRKAAIKNENVHQRIKYNSDASLMLIIWSWTQLVLTIGLMVYILLNVADFAFPDVFLYASFLMVSIFAYTALMDKHWIALPAELIKLIFGFLLIYRMNGWYNLDALFPNATLFVMIYLSVSLLSTVYFTAIERKNSNKGGQLIQI